MAGRLLFCLVCSFLFVFWVFVVFLVFGSVFRFVLILRPGILTGLCTGPQLPSFELVSLDEHAW